VNELRAPERWRPPLWYERLAGLSWRGVVIALALALLVTAVVELSAVVLPLFLGLLFASAGRRRLSIRSSSPSP
jgi:predicted cobalt transporter CbtA